MLIITMLKRLDSQPTHLLDALKWKATIFSTHFGFYCIFYNVICYVMSISTNKATYVMVAFECGSNYKIVFIDVFIVNLTLCNDLEINIDYYH
jgi:hypothetical protein